jgi:hypothetical protein
MASIVACSLNEPRAGVYCLFTLKWRRDDLCEGASVLNQTFTGPFLGCGVLLAHDHL